MNQNDISKLYDENKKLIADKCVVCGDTVYRYGIVGLGRENQDPIVCNNKRPNCKETFKQKIRLRPEIEVMGEEPKPEKPTENKKPDKLKSKKTPEITEANEMKD